MKSSAFLFLLCTVLPVLADPPAGPAESTPDASTPPADEGKVVHLDRFVVTGQLDRAREEIAPGLGASAFQIDRQQIEIQPLGSAAGFNQVILRVPGVAQDSFGQLHLRGEHANLQYRLNDVLLPEGLSGFGQELDTRFIDSASVLTGTLPAQFGYRTAGIVDLHTKGGVFHDGTTLALSAGSHATFAPSVETGGSHGAANYYVSASVDSNSLGIENPAPTASALHDHTTQGKFFGYVSATVDPTSRLSLIASFSDARFQIPNRPGLSPGYVLAGVPAFDSAQLDERQHETNAFFIAACQKSAGGWDGQIAAFARRSTLDYTPDPAGDLLFNGVASAVNRRITGGGLEGDLRWSAAASHTVRFGLLATTQTAANQNSTTVFPADATGHQTSPTPFTLAGRTNLDSRLLGVYLQDEWKLSDPLTLNYGTRADTSRATRTEGQLSPRVNAVWQASPATTVHAGYARYFTPPPLELVPEADLARFAGTTNASALTTNTPVRSERAHYFDLGLTHRISADFSVTLDSYLKLARDQLDEGQFGQALIFSPFNYATGRVLGAELSGNYTAGRFTAYANFAVSRATGRRIESGQFQFGPDELAYIASHDVHLDHDQTYTASLGVSSDWGKWQTYADALSGSGLRRGFANTGKLPSSAPVNLGVIRKFQPRPHTEISLRLDLVNVFDAVYELRDGSGIGVGAPQFGARRGVFTGVTWSY